MAGLIIIFGIFVQFALPGILLATIIILFIRKKLISIDKKSEMSIYIFIILICAFASCVFLLWKFEKPNELYIKMQEFNNNQSLVGLSKEEVEEILGKPGYKFDNENGDVYAYNAGKLDTGIFLGNTAILFDCTYDCELRISFDENDKVKHTSIHTNP